MYTLLYIFIDLCLTLKLKEMYHTVFEKALFREKIM